MKKILKNGLIGLLVVLVLYSISWIITCGLIKLITLCFGWTFKWSIATGIWIVTLLLKPIFSSSTTIKAR